MLAPRFIIQGYMFSCLNEEEVNGFFYCCSDGVSARMSAAAALLEAATRGDAATLAATLAANPRLADIVDEVTHTHSYSKQN
jgi:hypothetical protein